MARYKEAIPCFVKFIELEKSDKKGLTDACLFIGVSYYYSKMYAQAVEILQRGMKIDTTKMELYDTCGSSLYQLSRLISFLLLFI